MNDPTIDWLTAGLLLVGVIQAALFLWQLFIIRRTLEDTEDASRTAERAARATEVSVELASDTACRQLRAYIEPRLTGWRGISKGGNTIWGCQVSSINHGSTPAIISKFEGGFAILPFPLPQNYVFPGNTNQQTFRLIAYPNNEPHAPAGWIVAPGLFNQTSISQALTVASGFCAYAFGTVTYTDAFSKIRISSFRSFLDPASIQYDASGNIKTFVWAACEEGNDYL